MLDEKKPHDQIIEEMYIRALTRPATEKEKAAMLEILKDDPNPQITLEDTFWAILNSREFVFNH